MTRISFVDLPVTTVNITKSYRLPRHDQITHRLRIGQAFTTHGYLLKRESPLQCIECQIELTIKHVLKPCRTWNAIHVNYFTVSNPSDLFSQVFPRCIIDFNMEIGFFYRPMCSLRFKLVAYFCFNMWATALVEIVFTQPSRRRFYRLSFQYSF